ncbi:hypothetical protein ALQ14_200074 [Pseudomonas savastanoi pv. glycinea]|nr:hypothetical protein ALQ14_200074 [Pseudomonas savastanoi pv. glycinea]RMQ02776.1 hypothetical protein ALQ12_200129 [Pseudomonas savastanoi pv. glycinea]
MRGVSPTPAVEVVLVQPSHVRCCCSPRTRLANVVASCGEGQVEHTMPLLQLDGLIDAVSAALRPFSRLYPARVTSPTTLIGCWPDPPALLPPTQVIPSFPPCFST